MYSAWNSICRSTPCSAPRLVGGLCVRRLQIRSCRRLLLLMPLKNKSIQLLRRDGVA